MKKYIYLLFYCFVCSLPLFAQENGTPRKQAISQKDIFISFDCVKHLVFPVQVSDIAIGEQELVMASRVEEAPHIVRLSAQAEGFTEETNLTVVCIDGSVYTYHIRYLPEGGTDSYPNIYEDNGNGSTMTIRQKSATSIWPSSSFRRTSLTERPATRCPSLWPPTTTS